MKTILLSMSLITVISGYSQTVQKFLNVNQVNARILNGGDMHWDVFGTGDVSYEVPVGIGNHFDFASSLWVVGLDQYGQLYKAAQTYRQNGLDFWPGPLDTTDTSVTTIISNQ